jgi:hypothetical protein
VVVVLQLMRHLTHRLALSLLLLHLIPHFLLLLAPPGPSSSFPVLNGSNGREVLGVTPSQEPRAKSRDPRAESREPRAESQEPRAES